MITVGYRSTLQSRVTVAVGYGGLPLCLDRFQAGRLGYVTKMDFAVGPQLVPNAYAILKSQDFTTDFKISMGFRISRFKISGFHPRFCISTDFKIFTRSLQYKCNIAHNYAHGRRARLRISIEHEERGGNHNKKIARMRTTKLHYGPRPLLGAWPSCSHVISGMNHT